MQFCCVETSFLGAQCAPSQSVLKHPFDSNAANMSHDTLVTSLARRCAHGPRWLLQPVTVRRKWIKMEVLLGASHSATIDDNVFLQWHLSWGTTCRQVSLEKHRIFFVICCHFVIYCHFVVILSCEAASGFHFGAIFTVHCVCDRHAG